MALDNNDSSGFINSKIVVGDIVEDGKRLGQEIGNNGLISKLKILNFSTEHIAISFRDGTVTVIPPELSHQYSDCILIVHHKTNHKSPIQMIQGDEDELTGLLRTRLARSKSTELYWEEIIPINVINNSRNGVYCRASDVMVTLTDRFDFMASHPFSVQATHNLYLNAEEEFNPMYDVSLSIKLICNKGIQRRVYAVLNNRVVVINPKKSNTLEDGIYIAGLTQLDSVDCNTVRRHERFDVSEALAGKAPILFFETHVEALDWAAEKKNINALEQRTAREHDLIMADAKRQKEILENDNMKLKLEAARQKQIDDELASKREREFLEYKLKAENDLQIIKDKAALDAAKIKSYGDIAKAVVVTATLGLTLYKLFSSKK